MPIYSHSKLSTFEQCPLKFKFKYIDKIQPEIEKTIEAHLGSCVHSTLEWLYKTIKERGKSNFPSIDDVIVFYVDEWRKNFTKEILIVRNGLKEEDYFNKGIQFLLDYYISHQPFDENTLEVEKKIVITLHPEKEYKIQGFIDRLVHNLEKNEFEIHDYKTSGSLPSKEKIENDRQLALYSIAIKEIYGEDKEVILVWHYLHFNKEITSKRTDEQLKKLKDETIALIEKIESTKEFLPKKSPLCEWCEFKPICPAWNSEIDLEKVSKINLENSEGKTAEEKKNELNKNKFPTLLRYLRD